jgi:acetyltransferase-like isoleucine patch superfamily enzyme
MIKYLKKIALILFSYLPSEIKIGIYRLLGAKIESGVYLGLGSYILPFYSSFSSIRIGKKTNIGDNVMISSRGIEIGSEVEIKENARITGESRFSVGDFSYIGECNNQFKERCRAGQRSLHRGAQ